MVVKAIVIHNCEECPLIRLEDGNVYCFHSKAFSNLSVKNLFVGKMFSAPPIPSWCPLKDYQK